MNRRHFLTATAAAGLATLPGCGGSDYDFELLNVSYDPTRELYRKFNRMFAADYLEKTGKRVRIRQSHGGSGSQARSVNDGLPADVVTLAMWADTDSIRRNKLIVDNWEKRLPNNSLPYISTIVFVVRRGNPFGVREWSDLIEKPGLKVVSANPKTGGGAKLNLLGAWLNVLHRGGSARDARDFITHLYKRVPVLDTGARGATVTFARKGIGDVHLTWENEAYLEERELKGDVEIVRPQVSIQAEPHVALVDENAKRKGTTDAANSYLQFLYTPAAQDLIAELFFRPSTEAAAKKHADSFPNITLLRATDPKFQLGDWNKIQKDFFSEGGIFDQIYQS
jgi:sulfate/thiosulfate transport system substrate-binding protein